MKPNTKVVFTESPGSNTFEMQDIPAIAKAAHAGGADRHDGQHLGDAALFPGARHRRRHHASTRRPNIRPAIPTCCSAPCRRMRPAGERLHETFKTHGLLRRTGRCLPGAARSANHGGAARTAPEERTRNRPLAGNAARRRRVLHPGTGKPSGHAIWKRDFSGSSGIFSIVLPGGGKRRRMPSSMRCGIFGLGYSWGGYESLAVPVGLCRPHDCPGAATTDLCCACRSGSRMSKTSRPIFRAVWPPRGLRRAETLYR